ncbi:hypothetical protein LZC95_12125 [Pendulispora brunnea]|uniref:Uncharacterized protein n=1 Tax=Pendulispora brunnea TaxID=2905690 RepID=A0ABZ2KFX6_9BACT
MHRVTVTRGVVAAASLVLSVLAACSLTVSPGDYAQGGTSDAAAPRPPVPAGGARVLLLAGQRKAVGTADLDWSIEETMAGIIESDGTVGQFLYDRAPPIETSDYSQATIDNGRLLITAFVRGRFRGQPTPPRLAFAPIDTGSGAITRDWSMVEMDASAVPSQSSVSLVRPTMLVASGGVEPATLEDGGPTTVLSAKVLAASVDLDGRKAAWAPLEGALSGARSGARSFVHKDFLYVIGGRVEGGALSDVVDVTRLGADGKPGAFTAATKLPVAMGIPEVISAAGKLFVVGGLTSGDRVTAKVFAAPINEADGTLGPWVEGPAMPAALALGAVAFHGNRLYYFGGIAQTLNDAGAVADQNPTDGIYALDVAADGTLGTWRPVGKLPAPRGGLAAVVLP